VVETEAEGGEGEAAEMLVACADRDCGASRVAGNLGIIIGWNKSRETV